MVGGIKNTFIFYACTSVHKTLPPSPSFLQILIKGDMAEVEFDIF